MSYASKVYYTGDAVTQDFTIPFPYMSTTHVKVYVNTILQLPSMSYNFTGPSTIRFDDAPGIDAAIEIRRNTSPNATLVDFQDGSVLREADLDTSYLHNFYLGQEYADAWNELINNAFQKAATDVGIVETETDAMIAALVAEMLDDEAAAELQQRVNDIDTNAEAIIQLGDSLQVQINTIATQVAAQVFVQPNEPVPGVGGVPDPIPEGARWYDSDDNNHPYIYQTSAWLDIDDPRIGQAVADISVLQVDVADNAAAILTEQTARANADGAIAQTLSLIGAETDAGAAFLVDLNTTKVGASETLGQRFTSLQASIDSNAGGIATNSADIVTEQNARASGDSANASDITALDARMTTAEGDIVTNASAITATNANVSTNAGNISSNASSITALQSEVDLRATTFYQATAPAANNAGDLWIDSDNDELWRWSGSAWVKIQDAAIAANASAITALDTSVTTLDGTVTSLSSQVTSLSSQVTTLDGEVNTAQLDIVANTSAISTNDSSITALEAKYGVSLNVNGYITGFRQNNDGSTGSFVILADKFAMVDPSGDAGETEYTPFQIAGGVISMDANVQIDGDLIVSGTINGNRIDPLNPIGQAQIGAGAVDTDQLNAGAVTTLKLDALAVTAEKINVTNLAAIKADLGDITAGTITLDNAGYIRGGATGFESGTGFWMGYSSPFYKFFIGNTSTGNYMSWDGSQLKVSGLLEVGEYVYSSTDYVLEANTERSKSGSFVDNWVTKKTFTMGKDGQVRVECETRCNTTPNSPDYWNNTPKVRVTKNGVVQGSTYGVTQTNYLTDAWTVNVSKDDVIDIDITGGAIFDYYQGEPLVTVTCYVKNAKIGATVQIVDSGTVDLN